LKKVSIVIPALNEEESIAGTIGSIPLALLKKSGYRTEVIIVDNGSTDSTGKIARAKGAKVISEPRRGYGNAYKAGFENATGDFIATGDADLTYPLEKLPQLLRALEEQNLDFITTDRLSNLKSGIMGRTHFFGNTALTTVLNLLFGLKLNDSQSGMWVFRSAILPRLRLESSGMPFSQELKVEAYTKGLRCAEFPIPYRERRGKMKLRTFRDGALNLLHLFRKRFFP